MRNVKPIGRSSAGRETQIRAYQARKLRRYLKKVVLPFSSYYRSLFADHGIDPSDIESVEDLARLPLTSKADLMPASDGKERSSDFILQPAAERLKRRPTSIARALVRGRAFVERGLEEEFRPIFMTSTTGRSADPIPCFYTAYDLEWLSETGRRLIDIAGGDRSTRMVSVFPYAPHLAFWITHYGAMRAGAFLVSSGGGKVMGTEGSLHLIRRTRASVVSGMPTFIYHMLRLAVEEKYHLPFLRKIVLGGEKVPPGLRRKLADLAESLGAPEVEVLATYGLTEAKTAWVECPHAVDETPSGYHLYPDFAIMEVIDPVSGEPLPPNHAGELVLTPLEARGTVVLRYRTGDLIDGGITYASCPFCGREEPRIYGRISRRSDLKELRFDKIKGTQVDFNYLEHFLDDHPTIGAWQVELRKREDDPWEVDELIIHVERRSDTDEATVRQALKERFDEQLEIHPNAVVFHDTDEIRRLLGIGQLLKEERIVDHRPRVEAGEDQAFPRGAMRNGESMEVSDDR